MGDAVLDMSEVKVARVIEDAEPALRLLLRETRGRGRVVHIRTESPTEAYTWMAELDGRPGPVFGTPLAGFPDGAESGGPGCAAARPLFLFRLGALLWIGGLGPLSDASAQSVQ